jgi:hypothetical protein
LIKSFSFFTPENPGSSKIEEVLQMYSKAWLISYINYSQRFDMYDLNTKSACKCFFFPRPLGVISDVLVQIPP